MGFFSTASRSPIPGTATKNLLDYILQDEQNQKLSKIEQAKSAEASRIKGLSQSLLAVDMLDQDKLTVWAIQNEVSATELKALEPVIKQKEKEETWVDEETETHTQQRNFKTNQVINRVAKPVKLINKEDQFSTWQEDPITGEKKSIKDKETKLINKQNATHEWQENPITGEIKNRIEKKDPSEIGDKDRVADWYLKTEAQIRALYLGDNMQPSDAQRASYDRALLKAETEIEETSKRLNISKEDAVPIALSRIRKTAVLGQELKKTLPPVNRGITNFTSTQDETIKEVRNLVKSGVPVQSIGEALVEKGWQDNEVSELLDTAINELTPVQANLDVNKISTLRDGQSVVVKGVLWTRRGKYAVSDDGKKVKL